MGRYRTVVGVLAAVGVLALAGRFLVRVPPGGGWTVGSAAALAPAPPAGGPVPPGLLRPVRAPSLGSQGTCPVTPPARVTPAVLPGPGFVALGGGPVVAVLPRSRSGRGVEPGPVYWTAARPLGGLAVVRGRRLDIPVTRDPARGVLGFKGQLARWTTVEVLDPAGAGSLPGLRAQVWLTNRVDAQGGCWVLQVDGAAFSETMVVAFEGPPGSTGSRRRR